MTHKPAALPKNPNFSSGPCAKRPGWTLDALKDAPLGRSHRAKIGKAKLKLAIDLTRQVLEVPDDYRIGIVPASDTGAVEMAMWSLLGARGVDVLAWESFGEGWVTDIVKQLKLANVRVLKAPYGDIVDLNSVNFDNDVIFTWNGTTSGVRVPNGDWIAADRKGLTIADATSAAFAQKLDWAKLDVVDLFLAEGVGRRRRPRRAHSVAARGRAAGKLHAGLADAEDFPHDQRRQADRRHFRGRDDQHAVHALRRGLSRCARLGEVDRRAARHDRARQRQHQGSGRLGRQQPMGGVPGQGRADRAPTLRVCLKVVDPAIAALPADAQAAFAKKIVSLVEKEKAGYDIGSYRDAPAGLRIWCGATIEASDVALLTQWLDWAFATAKAELATA